MIDIIAWIGIVFAALMGARNVIELTVGKTKPDMTKPGARSDARASLLACLIVIAAGITLLGLGAKNDTAEWVARLATFAIVGFTLVWWLRSRLRA